MLVAHWANNAIVFRDSTADAVVNRCTWSKLSVTCELPRGWFDFLNSALR